MQSGSTLLCSLQVSQGHVMRQGRMEAGIEAGQDGGWDWES